MSKATSQKLGICTYCGFSKPVTSDHVPPKNLFPHPLPPDMITVPACKECNGGFKNDDDYFRLALTVTEKAKGQSARDAVLPAVVRGVNRREADRFRSALLSNSAILPRHSPAGVFLGHQRAMQFDGERLASTARRIIQGLFYRVKGHRLPDDHRVNVVPVGRLRQLTVGSSELGSTLSEFVDMVKAEPLTVRGTVFGYRWLQSPNGPSNTLWLLYFYEQLEFFCTTFPAAPPGLVTAPGSDGAQHTVDLAPRTQD